MKIGFFGCSFTEGGFNSPVYVDYAIKNNIIDISELDDKVKIWGNTEREAYETYGKDYNGLLLILYLKNIVIQQWLVKNLIVKLLILEANLMNILLKSYNEN